MYKYRGYIIERETDTRWRVIAPNGDFCGVFESDEIARLRVDVRINVDRYNEMLKDETATENFEGRFLYQDGFWLYFTTTNPVESS